MNLLIVTIILHITWTAATNLTQEAANKTKRTVAGQVQNYGENRPVLLYPENSGQNFANLYSPATLKPVFDPELPKQVAAQQVLYEFQQTPTNAVSNVHVNQFYQPVNKDNANPAQYVSGSESVATPVQHSSLVRHGQNYAQVQYQPYPQHVQTHQYIPGRLLYVNGKITYPQSGLNLQNQHGLNGLQAQNVFQRPHYMYQHPQTMTQKLIPPPLVVRPAAYRRFSPPEPHQIQQITKPLPVPEVKEEQNEEEEQEDNTNREEEVEEEDDEKESYEEDDEGDFSKYFDDDESYTEDDEDNERGSSKPVPKKHAKKTTKSNKHKGDNYKYRESYSSSSKYEKPTKKGRKITKNPKMHYTVKSYSKEGTKPRGEKIEGKQSQNVPVVHKQKVFEKKWYVTKSMDDSIL